MRFSEPDKRLPPWAMSMALRSTVVRLEWAKADGEIVKRRRVGTGKTTLLA